MNIKCKDMLNKDKETHYQFLGSSEKKIIQQDGGFFSFPQSMKGETKVGLRKFIIFYFDSEEDYQRASQFFDKNKCVHRLPYMDTTKLMSLLGGKDE